MRGIEAAFWGVLGKDPDLRTSKAGKPFCGLALAVTIGKADDGKDVTQWVRATCFGDAAGKIAASCKKGDRVYVEGTLTLNEWQGQDGEKRTGLNVAAWKAEKIGAIGKSRERRTDGDHLRPIEQPSQRGGFNDEIPF